MPNDMTIVIAEAKKISPIRQSLQLAGRSLYFTDSNLATALESIKMHRPPIVALEEQFAASPQGQAFVGRVQSLALVTTQIQLVMRAGTDWSIGEAGGSAEAVDPAQAGLNTRRAPRFRIIDTTPAVVDGQPASLVNVSVLGAQVVSNPVLRPNQKIKVALQEEGRGDLKLTAQVAWSLFEKPRPEQPPHYRAGIEFTEASPQLLEDFCKRHCADQPLPFRP